MENKTAATAGLVVLQPAAVVVGVMRLRSMSRERHRHPVIKLVFMTPHFSDGLGPIERKGGAGAQSSQPFEIVSCSAPIARRPAPAPAIIRKRIPIRGAWPTGDPPFVAASHECSTHRLAPLLLQRFPPCPLFSQDIRLPPNVFDSPFSCTPFASYCPPPAPRHPSKRRKPACCR